MNTQCLCLEIFCQSENVHTGSFKLTLNHGTSSGRSKTSYTICKLFTNFKFALNIGN